MDRTKMLKEKLNNSDNPALVLFEVTNKLIHLSKIIRKAEMSINSDPNEYLKKNDVIRIKIGETPADYAAIFLGKNEITNKIEVAHISGEDSYEKRIRDGNIN